MKRQSIKAQVREKGIEGAMRVKKGTLTPKMKAFAEQVALGEKGAEAYRLVYSSKAKPKTAGDNASRLKSDIRIQAEVERIERANQLAALHSAEGLRSIVISTLAEIATNPDSKDAVRVQAVRSIGQLVGVDAFRETKRVEHVKDSGQIRQQILDQLRTITMPADDADSAGVDNLLGELVGDAAPADRQASADSPTPEHQACPEPHPAPTPQNSEWDSAPCIHSIPHEATPQFTESEADNSLHSETPPMSFENEDPPGDIFLENQSSGNVAR